MKLLTAVIRPHLVEDAKQSLQELGLYGMTASEVKGFGRQQGHTEVYRGAEYRVDFLPKVKLELAVADAQLEQVVEAITQVARSGKFGDGKIFITELEDVIRIRTGETGESAL